MPRQKKIIEEPVSTPESSEDEKELPLEPPKLERQNAIVVAKPQKSVRKITKAVSENKETKADDESAEPAKPVKKEKKKRGPSLWMTILKENGYFLKGAEFKAQPKKDTPEYKRLKQLLEERKAA